MKQVIIVVLLLFGVYTVKAQMPQNAQQQLEQAQKMLKQMQSNPQIRQAMQQAKHMMDSLKSDKQFQNQMAQSRHALDSLKKTNPAFANMNMPDMSSVQVPSFGSMGNMLKTASNQLQAVSQVTNLTILKRNLTHHAEKLSKLTSASVTASVNAIIKKLKANFGSVTLNNLNAMVNDKKINVAATGAFMLASGADKNAALYLICNGILLKPKDPWAVNDLGVYYRDALDYEHSLQCYFYANQLAQGKSDVINSNIGWAAAYYGDFDAAKKYFDKALAIDKDFTSANEGEALLYYSEGDLGALWNLLAKNVKKIKFNSSAFDDGLSDDFATTCENASMEQTVNSALNHSETNPNDDHTFDNSEPSDDESQDPPPGADVDDITYPQFKRVFVSDVKDIPNAIAFWVSQAGAIKADAIAWQNKLKQTLQNKKDILGQPYWDNNGNLVYPKTFSKYIALFHMVEQQFERRCDWDTKQVVKKEENFQTEVIARDSSMWESYMKQLIACGKLDNAAKDACMKEVNCQWIPKMYHSKQNDLDVVAKMWDDYYDNIFHTIQWFINASAPFISRVHDEDWNQYLNTEREVEIRSIILNSYDEWMSCLGVCLSPVISPLFDKETPCPATEIAGITPPDPFSKKPKHIKEFEGPCYDITSSAFGTGLSAEQTCHSTTLSFEAGPFKAFYTHVDDPVYAQNNGYTNKIGASASVSKEVDIVKVGEGEDEQSLLSGSAGITGSVDLNFNNNWNFTSGSSSIGASADLGGLSLGGISATRTVEMVAGQLQVNPLTVNTTAPLH